MREIINSLIEELQKDNAIVTIEFAENKLDVFVTDGINGQTLIDLLELIANLLEVHVKELDVFVRQPSSIHITYWW